MREVRICKVYQPPDLYDCLTAFPIKQMKTTMFFKKIGVDPAVASGPLITTVNDLAAVVTYYGLVWILLINTLHMAG